MVDAEIGVYRPGWGHYGWSLYLTPPPSREQAVQAAGIIFLLIILAGFHALRRRGNPFIKYGALVFVVYMATILFFYVYHEATRDTLCTEHNRLTVREYIARYDCKREMYITQAMNMLDASPFHPPVNNSSPEKFIAYAGKQQEGIFSKFARIQIVKNQIFLRPVSLDATFHSETQRDRLMGIVWGMLSVLTDCRLPDVDFLAFVEDGFDGNFWPMSTAEGELYAPVFVQDVTPSAGAVLCPPRSIGYQETTSDFFDLAAVARQDNNLRWAPA